MKNKNIKDKRNLHSVLGLTRILQYISKDDVEACNAIFDSCIECYNRGLNTGYNIEESKQYFLIEK